MQLINYNWAYFCTLLNIHWPSKMYRIGKLCCHYQGDFGTHHGILEEHWNFWHNIWICEIFRGIWVGGWWEGYIFVHFLKIFIFLNYYIGGSKNERVKSPSTKLLHMKFNSMNCTLIIDSGTQFFFLTKKWFSTINFSMKFQKSD